jgi:hypothetical protein
MTAHVALWGKVPTHGDFLRLGSAAAPLSAFDAAFQALRLSEPARIAAFAGYPPVVSWIHHGDHWWCAVVLSSTDRVGRVAPVVACAGVHSLEPADELGVVPLAFGPFIQAVLGLRQQGWSPDADRILAALQVGADAVSLETAEDTFIAALEASSVASLWVPFGSADIGRQALRSLVAAASGILPSAGLRMSPVASPVQAGFWLSACWLVRGRNDTPGPIVLHPGVPGLAASVAVLWPAPTAADLAAALWPGIAAVESQATIINAPVATLPCPVALPEDCLQDPRAHLRDLLYRLVTQRRTQRYVRPT